MKKHISFIVLSTGLLSACTAPDYSKLDNVEQPVIEKESTTILSFNGLILDITEDNQLVVKVADPAEAQLNGLHVNPEGVMEVSLAAVNMSESQSAQIQEYLTDMAVGEKVAIDLPVTDLESGQAYIQLLSEEAPELIQKTLLENGWVSLADESEYKAYLTNFYNETATEVQQHLNDLKTIIIGEE